MSHWQQSSQTVTRDEHDAIMAGRRRPLTQGPMRRARTLDDDSTDSGLSTVDRVIADSRRATGAS